MLLGSLGEKNNEKKIEVDTDLIKLGRSFILDNFTKLSILAILAGYKGYDYIYVNDNLGEKIKLDRLGSFISYTLNHDIAPKKFKINIKHNEDYIKVISSKIDNDFDSILNFSGGIDSTAGLLYAMDKGYKVAPIWIDFGQRNNRAEYIAVNRVLKKLNIKPIIIKLDLNSFILEGWKDWNFIVPGRNFLFLSIANSILQRSNKSKKNIYLCAHKDEMGYKKNRDKSKFFFKASSNFFSDSGKNEIEVLTPFEKYSKSEVLSFWKRDWEKKFNITPYDTTTCYFESGCGKCEACLKRSIYLLASGYKIDPKIKVNPMRDPAKLMVNKWIPGIKSGKISRSNKLDFLIAVEKNIAVVPGEVCKFFMELPYQTKLAMSRRKEEIDLIKI